MADPITFSPAAAEAIFAGPWIVGGNTAKVKVLHELERLLAARADLAVLDVGCVGLQPLHFWEPLLGRYAFHLTGVDVAGIDQAAAVVRRRAWEDRVTLHRCSAYALLNRFGRDRFDVVVATQVLEHTARLRRALSEMAAVLRRGGEAFFTVDSAHYRARWTLRDPLRFAKNVAKRALALVGHERHYDLPWTAEELSSACVDAGLAVEEVGYYNLVPLKILHNRVLPEAEQNPFLRQWSALEERLNATGVAARARELFAAIYLRAGKR